VTTRLLLNALLKLGLKMRVTCMYFFKARHTLLELKNRKKLDLPAFWDEAQVEAKNYAKARGLGTEPSSFVVVKRRNSSVKNAWVIQNLEQWMRERHE
jgi:hypothetical protein